MDIEIRETHGKRPWVWHLRVRERVVIGGWAKTWKHAQKAARKAQRLTECKCCGKWAAGGGQRFCRPCLLWQLDQPINRTPIAVPAQAGKPYPTNHLKRWSQNEHEEKQ